MVKIPTPLPKTTVTSIKHFMTGPALDITWRIGLLVVFLLVLYALASTGGGVIIAFLVFTLGGIVLRDEVSAAVSDIYNRDFWWFEK